MQHECKITVLEKKCFTDYQEQYLANPKSGPCPFFHVGDEFILKRTPQQDDFYHLMDGRFCGEAWDAVSRYVYTALQGGSKRAGISEAPAGFRRAVWVFLLTCIPRYTTQGLPYSFPGRFPCPASRPWRPPCGFDSSASSFRCSCKVLSRSPEESGPSSC